MLPGSMVQYHQISLMNPDEEFVKKLSRRFYNIFPYQFLIIHGCRMVLELHGPFQQLPFVDLYLT